MDKSELMVHRRMYRAYLECKAPEKAEQVRQYVLTRYGVDLGVDMKGA